MNAPEASIALDVQTNADVVSSNIPRKGAISVFEPENSRAIQAAIKAGEPIPEGAFSGGKLFSLELSDAKALKEARFDLPQLHYVAEVLEQYHAEDSRESLAAQLLKLEVNAAYDSAVMVEAARQYHEKRRLGTLSDSEAEWLKNLLNVAQDRSAPLLDAKLAHTALERISGQEPSEQLLSPDTREAWGKFLHAKFDQVFADIYEQFDDGQEINGLRLAHMTAAFMKTTGLEMTDPAVIETEDGNDESKWSVLYDPALSSFNVGARTKVVRTGDRNEALDQLGFEKLMVHEILIHAWRGENGSRTGYTAFQTGLPGYSEAEEGAGILAESLWTGQDPDIMSRDHFRYAAVAYACGTYDGVQHNEQETYEFTKKLMDNADVHDDAELYRHVMRIFRGMPDGCRMRSNAAYLAGKTKIMQYLEEQNSAGKTPEEVFLHLQKGKFDPTDPVHAELIERI